MPQEYAYFIHIEFFHTYPIGFFFFFQTTSRLLSQFSSTRLKIEKKMKNEKKPHHFLKDRGQ